MKKTFPQELAYAAGLALLALGTAITEKANFGMSMIVAPAYLVHLKLSETLPWFSFGVAEYALQALLLIALGLILRRFSPKYLFSFVTAVLYGAALDGCIALISGLNAAAIPAYAPRLSGTSHNASGR